MSDKFKGKFILRKENNQQNVVTMTITMCGGDRTEAAGSGGVGGASGVIDRLQGIRTAPGDSDVLLIPQVDPYSNVR